MPAPHEPMPVDAGLRQTFAASIDYYGPAATPTDIVSIAGSATKVIKILRVALSSTQTTAGVNKWYLIKRLAANTGGTAAAATAVPLDSNNSAATATVNKITANQTVGTAVGTIKTISGLSPAAASVAAGEVVLFDQALTGQPIVLRGAAEVLAVNFAGAAVPTGLSAAYNIIWTEE